MAKPPLETHKKIYPFHANVERRLDRKIELSEKIEYAQTRRYNTKFHDPSKKNRTPWLWVDFYEGAIAFRISIFIFCLKPMVKKNIWTRTISVTIMVIISKVLFWKLLDISKNISDISYVQSTFLTFMLRKWAEMSRKLSVVQKP